jgi:phenylacetate-CoA ligase
MTRPQAPAPDIDAASVRNALRTLRNVNAPGVRDCPIIVEYGRFAAWRERVFFYTHNHGRWACGTLAVTRAGTYATPTTAVAASETPIAVVGTLTAAGAHRNVGSMSRGRHKRRRRSRSNRPQASSTRKGTRMSNPQDILRAPHERIEQIQLEGFKKTAVNCYENIPFYKKSFDDAGFNPYAITSLADVAKAPFVTKQDLRDAYPYGMFAVPLDQVREIHMSSGTTGVATVGGYTKHDLDIWADCFARGLWYAGCGKGDVVQVAYGYGLFTGGLGAHYGSMRSGATVIPTSAGSTERQIRIMREMGTTALCCTPSYAMHIADTAIDMGLDPAKDFTLKCGIHGAEAFSDNLRAELERKLDYKVLDIYGLTETMGPGVAIECLEQNGLHLAEDHFYAEIIDPKTGENFCPTASGASSCSRRSTARPARSCATARATSRAFCPATCACGRTHRRIDRLHGRTDDMLIIRGVNVFPSQIEDVMETFPEVSSWYQIELTTQETALDVVTLKVEVNPDFAFDKIARDREAAEAP